MAEDREGKKRTGICGSQGCHQPPVQSRRDGGGEEGGEEKGGGSTNQPADNESKQASFPFFLRVGEGE